MDKLINSIISKEYKEAESSLKEELSSIVEKKLAEKKKMLAAGPPESPFKTEVERTGSVKAQRKPLKGVTKVVKEAMVGKDGLVHLNTGENILPSVYRQRRWLAESNEWSDWMADTYHDLKDHKDKNVKHHVRMAMAQQKKGNTEDAHEHMKAAQKAAHKLAAVKEDAGEDIQGIIKGLTARAKAAVPEKADEIESISKKAQEKAPEALSKAQDVLSKVRDQVQMKEDCGLAPDLEKKVEAARAMAKLLLQPQLDTTALTVDRTKVSIPKGMRKSDHLTAPDLGPKEDEWMHGKKLEEALGSLKNIKASARAAAERASDIAKREFDKEKAKKKK